VIAHRGASGYRPEHSRSAYELAIAQGADAVEPDIVATRDGVLVVRHENQISGTTDVAQHPEFADRRTTKEIDGQRLTGWFTEDFTWDELSTLRVRERIPALRPHSVRYDRSEPMLRLSEVRDLVEGAGIRMVAEIKHATYFASIGLPLDELFADQMAGWRGDLVVESFEQSVLHLVRARGVAAPLVYLVESHGAPFDLVARDGSRARSYADHVTDEGLRELATSVDGVSVDKSLILPKDADDRATGITDIVARAHDFGLTAYTWTLRAENFFLARNFQTGPADERGDWRSEFALLMSSGVDGVFADQPDLAIEVRDGPHRPEKGGLGSIGPE
jgi:glycerophosphoryl diester phosphodiesterase